MATKKITGKTVELDPKVLLNQRKLAVEQAGEELEELRGEIRSGNESITPADLADATAAIEFAKLKVEAAEAGIRRAAAVASKSDELALALLDDVSNALKVPVKLSNKMPTGEPNDGQVPQAYIVPQTMKHGEAMALTWLEGQVRVGYIRDELSGTPDAAKVDARLNAAGHSCTVVDAGMVTLSDGRELDTYRVTVHRAFGKVPTTSPGAGTWQLHMFAKNIGHKVIDRTYSYYNNEPTLFTVSSGTKVFSDSTDAEGVRKIVIQSGLSAHNAQYHTASISDLIDHVERTLEDMVGTVDVHGRVTGVEVIKTGPTTGSYQSVGGHVSFNMTFVSKR